MLYAFIPYQIFIFMSHKILTAAVSPEMILLHDPGICVPFYVSSAFKVPGSAYTSMELQVARILRKLWRCIDAVNAASELCMIKEEIVDWILLAQVRAQWLSVNEVMKPCFL